MNPRVSVPKIFLRGNRWYIRVQVPKSMQERLKRKEYWVSLRTSDRVEALQYATAATQKKRREISAVYRRLSDIKETLHELDKDQQIALGREAYAAHISCGADLIAEFEGSACETLKEFTDARSEAVDGVVARLLLARSDTPHMRIMAYKLMEDNGIRLLEGSVALNQLLGICADTFIEAKRNELAKLRGHAVHDAPNPHYVNTVTGGPKDYISLADQLATPPEPTPSLTELMEVFLANPNKLRAAKTKKSIRGYLRVVFHILGDDTPIEEITEEDCENVRDLIAKLRGGRAAVEAQDLLMLHRRTYHQFWSWSDQMLETALIRGWIETVFGWRCHLPVHPNERSIRNFPMQANGAEMLRLACIYATEAEIEVCAPVHDAVLIHGPLGRLDDDIAHMQEMMVEASRVVLGGFTIQAGVERFDYPDRFTDDRGARMWSHVEKWTV